MKKHKVRASYTRNAGFSLVEILVTVLILAIGLLGLAGLQMRGLKNNHSAYMRSQATQLAYDLTDRMRANPVGITGGAYNNPTLASTPPDCVTNACSAADMAAYDFAHWLGGITGDRNGISDHLPNGTGVVCLDATPNDNACDNTGSIYAIKISWSDRESGDSVPRTFITSFQP